jgi:hypothetical protein
VGLRAVRRVRDQARPEGGRVESRTQARWLGLGAGAAAGCREGGSTVAVENPVARQGGRHGESGAGVEEEVKLTGEEDEDELRTRMSDRGS